MHLQACGKLRISRKSVVLEGGDISVHASALWENKLGFDGAGFWLTFCQRILGSLVVKGRQQHPASSLLFWSVPFPKQIFLKLSMSSLLDSQLNTHMSKQTKEIVYWIFTVLLCVFVPF